MDNQERLNALEVALNNEQREREFYLKNAERTKNPFGKAMFKQIGDEELEHYTRLKQLHDEWKKMGKWPETVPLKVKDTVIRDVLLNAIGSIDKNAPSDSDDLAAVQTAIDFEAKGVKYYADMKDAVTDPQEKEFFDLLSRIEREHYLSLKDIEEYFTDPASYFMRVEHHTLDGA